MKVIAFVGTAILIFWATLCIAADEPQFSDVVIEKHFKLYLLGNPLLMEVTGAKVIRQKNGQTVLLSVSSTVLKDDSAKERLRAEKVCRTKALAGIVAADYHDLAELTEGELEFSSQQELDDHIARLESDMREAAKRFEFEKAAKLRDAIRDLKTKEFLFA